MLLSEAELSAKQNRLYDGLPLDLISPLNENTRFLQKPTNHLPEKGSGAFVSSGRASPLPVLHGWIERQTDRQIDDCQQCFAAWDRNYSPLGSWEAF